MNIHPAGIPLLIAGWLIASPAFAQMDRPVQRLDPAQIYQADEDDGDEDGDAAAVPQISSQTLRAIQNRQAPAQISPDAIMRRPAGTPLRPIQMPDLQDLRTPAAWHFASASARGAINETRATPESGRPLQPVAALSRFRLSFTPGRDHKIRRMAVLAEDRFARFSLADQDSNDRFIGSAQWAVMTQGQQHEVSGNGGGTFHLPLVPGPSGHTAVLTGFDIQRQGGTDANVRTFAIWLEEDEDGNPVARVTLQDDMGEDFRGFAEAMFAGMAASLIPTVEIVASHAVAVDGLSRYSAQGGPRPFAATIQYAWIPDSLIVREGAAAGGNGSRDFPGPQQVALQGFLFHFDNSDHHLLEVRVDPGDAVEYRDNDRDDPMRWEVQYVELNDEMRD